jgi:hypothetical protein
VPGARLCAGFRFEPPAGLNPAYLLLSRSQLCSVYPIEQKKNTYQC